MLPPSQTAAASSKVMPAGLCATRRALADADELRVRAEALDAEDLVTDLELADGRADRLDLSRQLHAEDPPPAAGADR